MSEKNEYEKIFEENKEPRNNELQKYNEGEKIILPDCTEGEIVSVRPFVQMMDWKCSKDHQNVGTNKACASCGEDISTDVERIKNPNHEKTYDPKIVQQVLDAKMYWKCACGAVSRHNDEYCSSQACDLPRDQSGNLNTSTNAVFLDSNPKRDKEVLNPEDVDRNIAEQKKNENLIARVLTYMPGGKKLKNYILGGAASVLFAFGGGISYKNLKTYPVTATIESTSRKKSIDINKIVTKTDFARGKIPFGDKYTLVGEPSREPTGRIIKEPNGTKLVNEVRTKIVKIKEMQQVESIIDYEESYGTMDAETDKTGSGYQYGEDVVYKVRKPITEMVEKEVIVDKEVSYDTLVPQPVYIQKPEYDWKYKYTYEEEIYSRTVTSSGTGQDIIAREDIELNLIPGIETAGAQKGLYTICVVEDTDDKKRMMYIGRGTYFDGAYGLRTGYS